jgi:hypothetical protein
MAFVVGMNLVTSADSASPSGTSIPVTKGGTGSTTEQGALQNLLPDFDSNNGKVLGSTGSAIEWVEQNNPEIQSSSDIGKVKVDDTAKTMTVSGETAVSGGVVYSINRPDKWIANTELDFGGGLYGYLRTGSMSNGARTPWGISATKIWSGNLFMATTAGFISTPVQSGGDGADDTIVARGYVDIRGNQLGWGTLASSSGVVGKGEFAWVLYSK